MYERQKQYSSKKHGRGGQPKPMSGVLARVISSLGIAKSYNGWQVVNLWPEIVGKEIASRADAIRFEDGCIYVAVKDSAWRQELSMRQEELLEKIRSYPYGRTVNEIRLVQGGKGFEENGD
jgi:predicted nucleic acid-binding Zn ribbon protein